MRLLLNLTARRDVAYNPEYHHHLRGVIWDYLRDTKYADWHGQRNKITFTYSNPFPVTDPKEGNEQSVLVSSPHNGLVETLYNNIQPEDEFNIGEMPFLVDNASLFEVDVGEPGTEGTLHTDTGVYIPLPKEKWDEYGIDVPYNTEQIGWSPEFDTSLFLDRVVKNVEWKQSQLYGDYLETPDRYGLFDGYNFEKCYSVDTKVSSEGSGYEYTFVVTKWTFDYRVRSEDHRRWLNILLRSGIGWRNALGFGFLNIQSDTND